MVSNDPAVQFDVVTDLGGLASLEASWRALELRSDISSIFMSWDWQSLWWRHYGGSRALRVVVARRAGTVVGILPLYIQRGQSLGVWPVRSLRTVGTGGDTSPDYLDPLIDRQHAEAVSAGFVEFVMTQLGGWDVLRLSDLSPDARFTKAMAERCRRQGCFVNVAESASIPFGRLPDRWESYLGSLSANRRQALRYSRRKFEALEGARFRLCTDPAELDAVFQRLVRLHHLRWQGRTTRHSFASNEYLSFHSALIHALNGRQRLRFYLLEAKGEIFAILYCFKFDNALLYFQSGFDPAMSEFSPGKVLISYAIESAIEEGCAIFDMLKGDYDHKRHFFKDTRVTVQINAYRAGFPAWGYKFKQFVSGFARRAGAVVGPYRNLPMLLPVGLIA